MSDNSLHQSETFSTRRVGIRDAVQLLSSLAQAVNPQLCQHMMEVSKLSRRVGERMRLGNAQIDQVEVAGMIHDIGLLSLPKELQNKDPGLLTQKEHLQYCEHPVIASIALEGIESLKDVGEMVLYHHEHMDGKGFPNGLNGDQIPVGSRILLAVSDYCRIIATWPRNMGRLVSHARRQLGVEEWKRFSFTDDPESIIQASAERLLMMNSDGKYDSVVVKALMGAIHKKSNIDLVDMISLDDLKAGMVLMDDLRLDGGRLLITKGTKLVDASVQTLQGLGARHMIPRKVYVAVPGQTDNP